MIVETASASDATIVTLRTRPIVSARRPGDHRPPSSGLLGIPQRMPRLADSCRRAGSRAGPRLGALAVELGEPTSDRDEQSRGGIVLLRLERQDLRLVVAHLGDHHQGRWPFALEIELDPAESLDRDVERDAAIGGDEEALVRHEETSVPGSGLHRELL